MKDMEIMKKVNLFLVFALALIVSCSSNNSSDQTHQTPDIVEHEVIVDSMGAVPNINGASSSGVIYVHNYSRLAVNNIKIKNLSADYGAKLINPEKCDEILADGACAIKFITPRLELASSGNTAVRISYSQNGVVHSFTHVINYTYVSLEQNTGVNFIGEIQLSVLQGKKRHAVAYLYASGKPGDVYKNVIVKMSHSSSAIKPNVAFTLGRDIAVGSVIPVEFDIDMQSNKAIAAQGYASWGDNNTSGGVVQLNVDPIPDTPNYLFGAASIMKAPSVEVNNVAVTNNGSTDGASGIMAYLVAGSGTNENNLIIDQGCANTPLLKKSANSCSIGYSVTATTSGNALVEYREGDKVVGSQRIYWVGKDAKVQLVITTNSGDFSMNKGDIQNPNAVVISVTNIGTASLRDVLIKPKLTNSAAMQWVEDFNNCPLQIDSYIICSIKGHFESLDAGVGKFFYTFQGTSNSGMPYSVPSKVVNYTVTNLIPQLDLTLDSESPMEVIANNTDYTTRTFTLLNSGKITANITKYELNFDSQTITKPSIVANDCPLALAVGQSCSITLGYGHIPQSQISTNEEGTANLIVSFTGLSTDPNTYSVMKSINYKAYANDINVTISQPTVVNLTGTGTPGDPFNGTAKAQPSMSFIYTNNSTKFDLKNFNVAKNTIPLGMVVDPASDCPVGSKVGTLKVGAFCTLVIVWDRDLLTSIPTADSVMSFIVTPPKASWRTTEFGSDSKTSSDVYNVTYQQPKITATSQQVARTMQLSLTAVNLEAGSQPLGIAISGVKDVSPITTAPTIVSGNCTVNQSDFSISCSDFDQAILISYPLPSYLDSGQVVDINLALAVTGSFAVADSSIIMHYVAPEKKMTWNLVSNSYISPTSFIFSARSLNGKIYALGWTSPNTVAVWVGDGSSWSKLGNTDIPNAINAEEFVFDSNGKLYVGGQTTANIGGVWQWDGASWIQMSGAFTRAEVIYNTAVDSSNNVYITGNIVNNPDNPQDDVAAVWKWNGSSWSQVGGDLTTMNNPQKIIVGNDGAIYVSGQNTTSILAQVWRWNGSAWSQVGGDFSNMGTISSIAMDNSGNLYGIGADDSTQLVYLFKWNGSAWSTVGGAIPNAWFDPKDLVIDSHGNIFVSAFYNGSFVAGVWMWDGSKWTLTSGNPLGGASEIWSLFIDQASGDIYAGGVSVTNVGGVWRGSFN